MTEPFFMHQAIALAKKGQGFVSPNPLVGAVIVKNGTLIGQGYHAKAGDFHAERAALLSCTENPNGASLFVTLEPCCHQGRTPPCTDAIVKAGVSHVFVGSPDPNPLVRGKGIEILKKAGIQVTEGFLREECDSLNPIFFHYIKNKMPYVALKYAMTADGKIATTTGASRWISNEVSRNHAHGLRHQYRGVLVGIGTVLADDPLLTCRVPGGQQPVRILCDSHLRLPLESQICHTSKDIPTIVAFARADEKKQAALVAQGIVLWHLPNTHGQVSLPLLMKRLAEEEIDSLLVEGGAAIHYGMLEGNLAQKLYVYVAPKIFGGTAAPSPVGGMGVTATEDAFSLTLTHTEILEGDCLLEYDIQPKKGAYPCSQD